MLRAQKEERESEGGRAGEEKSREVNKAYDHRSAGTETILSKQPGRPSHTLSVSGSSSCSFI